MLGKLRDRATTFMKTPKTDSDRRGALVAFPEISRTGAKRRSGGDLAAAALRADLDSILYF